MTLSPWSKAKASKYVLYLPPSGALPVNSTQGRYEYFLFQWLKSQNIAVFIVEVPIHGWDVWDHIPPHTSASPYNYDCAKITSAYGGLCEPQLLGTPHPGPCAGCWGLDRSIRYVISI